MHEIMHENMKIRTKMRGKMVLPALREKKPCKNLVENEKKSSMEPCQVGEREERLIFF